MYIKALVCGMKKHCKVGIIIPHLFIPNYSILGVLVNNKMNNGQAFTTDYDANQCTSTGYYPIGTSGFVPYEDIHLPSGSNVIIVTLNFIAYYILQLGVEQQGKLFWREQTDRTNWTAWKEL